MKNLAKILLCGLFVPVNMALGFGLYYDVNGVCNGGDTSLWCESEPSKGDCCSGNSVIEDLADTLRSRLGEKPGYVFRGWTKEHVSDVYTSAESLVGRLVIGKNGDMKGSISDASTLYPAWAASCNNPDYCGVNVGEDGSVSYSPTCPEGWASSGVGASISCYEPDPGDTIITIQYDGGEHGTITGNTSQTCVEGTITTLQDGTIVTAKTGWKFAGEWLAGNGARYDAGSEIECNSNISHLTATYNHADYFITYVLGPGVSLMNNYSINTYCQYGGYINLPDVIDVIVADGSKTLSRWVIDGEEHIPGTQVSCNNNMTITAVYTENPQWVKFVLNANGGTLYQVQEFYCQLKSGINSCPRGCYNSTESCANDNVFAEMGSGALPYRKNFKFRGFSVDSGNTVTQVLDADGILVGDNWSRFSSDTTLDADWYENKIDIKYQKGSTCSGTGSVSLSLSCSVDGTFNLPNNENVSGILGVNQHLSGWRVNGQKIDPGEEIDCTRDQLGGDEGTEALITAVCETKPLTDDENITLRGFYAN